MSEHEFTWPIIPPKTFASSLINNNEPGIDTSRPEFTLRPFSVNDIDKMHSGSEAFMANCIGYMRSDFGRRGNEFWHTWWPNHEVMNTLEFKELFDRYVNWLRNSIGVMGGLREMTAYCKAHPEVKQTVLLCRHFYLSQRQRNIRLTCAVSLVPDTITPTYFAAPTNKNAGVAWQEQNNLFHAVK